MTKQGTVRAGRKQRVKRERPCRTYTLTKDNLAYINRAAGQANMTVSRFLDTLIVEHRAKVGAK